MIKYWQATHPGTEGGDGSVGVHETVGVGDTLHLAHDTEGHVVLDKVLLVEPAGHLLVEGPSGSLIGLSLTVEAVVGVLGDPNLLAGLSVEVGDVLLEVLSADVVVVEGDKVGVTVGGRVTGGNTSLGEVLRY